MSSLLTSSPSHQITFNVKKWSHLEGQKTSEIFLMVVVVFSVGDVVFFALHCPPRTSVLPFEDGLVGVSVVVVVAVARLAQPRYEKNEKVSSQKNDRFFISAKSVQCHWLFTFSKSLSRSLVLSLSIHLALPFAKNCKKSFFPSWKFVNGDFLNEKWFSSRSRCCDFPEWRCPKRNFFFIRVVKTFRLPEKINIKVGLWNIARRGKAFVRSAGQ